MSALISIVLFTTLASTLCSAYPTREHGYGLRTRRWRRFIEPLQVPVETPVFGAPQAPTAPQPTFAPSVALPAPTSFSAPEPTPVAPPPAAAVAAIPMLPNGVPGWYQSDLGFDSPMANAVASGQIIGGPSNAQVNVSVPGISTPALAPATSIQVPASAPVPFPPALGSAVPNCQGYYGIKSANPMYASLLCCTLLYCLQACLFCKQPVHFTNICAWWRGTRRSDVFAQCVLRNLLPMRNLATVEGLQLGPCGQIGNAQRVFAGCIDTSGSGRMGMSIDGAFCLAYSFMNNGTMIVCA